MYEFTKLVAKHQHDLINAELQRIMGPSAPNRPVFSINHTSPYLEHSRTGAMYIYQVQCKVMHRFCQHEHLIGPQGSKVFPVGSIVLFTGPDDNSQSLNVGVVVRAYTEQQWTEKVSKMRPFNDKEEGELKRVVRLASEEECLLLPRKYEKEEQLLAVCQSYVRDVYRLPIVVYGAEFQFDGKVLTFYYTSDVRADYRELVRTMFNQCNVRIMMRKTNQCKKFVPVPFATQALRTGVISGQG